MADFLQKLDSFAAIEAENTFARWLERIAFVFLVLMVLSAPHSIAATQIAWLSGMFAWLIRLFIKPRPKLIRTPLDVALWVFLGWSIVSSIFSYAPDISVDRLRNVLLFWIFYYVINNLRRARVVKFLACALVFSCMVSVIWTPIERIFGRGVEVQGVKTDGFLSKGNVREGLPIRDGDTIIEVGKKKIRSPEALIDEIEKNEVSQVKYYRPDFNSIVEVRRADLPTGANALERLGFENWKHSRNWRSAGFYGHYTTFAEVLQLIMSLAFGLFIASIRMKVEEFGSGGVRELGSSGVGELRENKVGFFSRNSIFRKIASSRFSTPFLPFSLSPLLLFCVAAMGVALLLTVTRASQLGFLISAATIVLVNGNRKLILTLAVIVLPVALGGLIFLQQTRKVGFFDTQDDSIKYRETMYRDGFRLWTESPRHFMLGVGMDSIQRYWRDWNLFDGGRLPLGHFHSTPLQLAVERGLPALLIWLWIIWIYARTLLRHYRRSVAAKKDWLTTGIILGCLGGAIGFFSGGIVHYNLGDAEVAMAFFLLMGLSVSPVLQNSAED